MEGRPLFPFTRCLHFFPLHLLCTSLLWHARPIVWRALAFDQLNIGSNLAVTWELLRGVVNKGLTPERFVWAPQLISEQTKLGSLKVT